MDPLLIAYSFFKKMYYFKKFPHSRSLNCNFENHMTVMIKNIVDRWPTADKNWFRFF